MKTDCSVLNYKAISQAFRALLGTPRCHGSSATARSVRLEPTDLVLRVVAAAARSDASASASGSSQTRWERANWSAALFSSDQMQLRASVRAGASLHAPGTPRLVAYDENRESKRDRSPQELPPVAAERVKERRAVQHGEEERGPHVINGAKQPRSRPGEYSHFHVHERGRQTRDRTHGPRNQCVVRDAQQVDRELRWEAALPREATGREHVPCQCRSKREKSTRDDAQRDLPARRLGLRPLKFVEAGLRTHTVGSRVGTEGPFQGGGRINISPLAAVVLGLFCPSGGRTTACSTPRMPSGHVPERTLGRGVS